MCLCGVVSSVVLFGARGDCFIVGVVFYLVLLAVCWCCVGVDWARFGCGARVRSWGVFLGVVRAGVFGVIGWGVFGRGLFHHGCWRSYPARGERIVVCVWRGWFSAFGSGVVMFAIGCFCA